MTGAGPGDPRIRVCLSGPGPGRDAAAASPVAAASAGCVSGPTAAFAVCAAVPASAWRPGQGWGCAAPAADGPDPVSAGAVAAPWTAERPTCPAAAGIAGHASGRPCWAVRDAAAEATPSDGRPGCWDAR